jgi:hypothetical protein
MELPRELPRELQVYICSYLYNPWIKKWRKVIESIRNIHILNRILPLSHLCLRTWMTPKIIQCHICLDCGNYYQIPLYSLSVVGCDCP